MKTRTLLPTLILFLSPAALPQQQQPLGIFESHTDVGVTPKPGAAEFANNEYRITGGGANIWANADAFHFTSKQMTGDFTLTADVSFLGTGAVAHRKIVLMARQDLSPGSAYADIALHGDGLTSLQYRTAADGATQENRGTITATVSAPTHLRLERHGNTFTASAGPGSGELQRVAEATVPLNGPVYVGIGVCSHDANVLETAVFSNVRLETPRPRYRSHMTILDLKSRKTRELFRAEEVWEAPNWSHDGTYLLANSGGRLYRVPLDGAKPEPLALDAGLRCNNDHGFSPDAKHIAVSASTPESHGSQVYIADVDGSNAKKIVDPVPSYFHGWSPDGKWLAVVAQRNKNFDLYRYAPDGSGEQRLTSSPGYDDGPDYSPDGKWIYFNSDRSGSWDIWRMPAAGAGANDEKAQRITSDDAEDWFPHPSPDGKWLVFLSFPHGTTGHNDKRNVELRMIPLPKANPKAAKPESIAKFFGGQGTINVNSWSPDSKQFAYVVYELIQ